jgi:hypothetical protein
MGRLRSNLSQLILSQLLQITFTVKMIQSPHKRRDEEAQNEVQSKIRVHADRFFFSAIPAPTVPY